MALRFTLLALLVCALCACSESFITAPHQPYTALLDHAGQLDISARGGAITTNTMAGAVQVAYAPIDNLEIAVSADADLVNSDDSRTLHVGGGGAIGTFARNDVFRLEGLIGLNGGYSEGRGNLCTASMTSACAVNETFGLTGGYVQPFIQGAVGLEIPYFEFAGGLRLWSTSVNVSSVGDHGTTVNDWFTRAFVEPYVTLRVPIEWFRIEALTGVPFGINGNNGPIPGTTEPASYWYAVLGLAVQIDTMGSPIPEHGSYIVPAPN